MRKILTLVAVLLAFFFSFQNVSLAQVTDCTRIPSVTFSSSPLNNNAYGGHLNAHIYGQTPPFNFTQNRRTLFSNSLDWQESYLALERQIPPLQCAQAAPIGSEAARTLPRQFFSLRCTAADAAGRCTQYTTIQTNYVNYVLRVVPDGISRWWILYTAYPTETRP